MYFGAREGCRDSLGWGHGLYRIPLVVRGSPDLLYPTPSLGEATTLQPWSVHLEHLPMALLCLFGHSSASRPGSGVIAHALVIRKPVFCCSPEFFGFSEKATEKGCASSRQSVEHWEGLLGIRAG